MRLKGKIMKHTKIFVSVFISILFLFTAAVPVLAAPIPEDSIKAINIFTEDGKQGKSIDSCSFDDPVWEFPSEYQGKTVYGIEELGPNQTTAEVIIPEGVESLNGSFSEFSALKKATLPSTLKRISDYSFYQCGALSEISLPDGLLSNAFSGCTSLKEVKLGSGVKVINSYTFRDCENLERVTFSEGLETVGDEAFLNTAVKTLTLPGSIRRLGVRAFNFEQLEKITYEGTKAEFEAIVNDAFESAYSDKITVECTDGTIIHNNSADVTDSEETVNTSSDTVSKDGADSPDGGNSSAGSSAGVIAAVVAVFIVICGGAAAFLLMKRNLRRCGGIFAYETQKRKRSINTGNKNHITKEKCIYENQKEFSGNLNLSGCIHRRRGVELCERNA